MKAKENPALEEAMGYRFQHPELLQQALTHSSYAHESESRQDATAPHNEQLEFLGDAVLGFVTSLELFQRFPHYSEGELSKMRAHLVSARHLVRVAGELELGRFLRLGRGEEKSGGRAKSALLVNTLEAVLAAVYLDGGLARAREIVVRRVLEPELERLLTDSAKGMPVMDHKSALQEFLQGIGSPQPSYRVVREEGPEHKKTFTVELRVHGAEGNGQPVVVSRAEGSTKKRAEQHAARQALEQLRVGAGKE